MPTAARCTHAVDRKTPSWQCSESCAPPCAALAALESVEGRPEITYVISALRVATGRRGSSFGTAHSITVLLDGLLGESGYAPEEEPTT